MEVIDHASPPSSLRTDHCVPFQCASAPRPPAQTSAAAVPQTANRPNGAPVSTDIQLVPFRWMVVFSPTPHASLGPEAQIALRPKLVGGSVNEVSQLVPSQSCWPATQSSEPAIETETGFVSTGTSDNLVQVPACSDDIAPSPKHQV